MKVYYFNINDAFLDIFFKPIRTKHDLLLVLLKSIKYMLINTVCDKHDCTNSIIVYINKNSRLIFNSENKKYSISFPFYSSIDENNYIQFKNNDGIIIDNQLTSDIIAIIEEYCESTINDIYDLLSLFDGNNISTNECFNTLKQILSTESGYIRYDYDLDHENINHPINHYDFFYSNSCKCKIGLEKKIYLDDFIEILDIEKECKYIKM